MISTSVESAISHKFDLEQGNRSQFLAAQIKAGTGQRWGQVQYKTGQVEPTRDTLEPDLGKGTVQAY